MMKITLFRDMKAECWPSMDRYAETIALHLRGIGLNLEVFSSEPPIRFSSALRMFWRREIYPRLAARKQSGINHILDHSYAHLMNFLRPQRTVVSCHDLIPLEFDENKETREAFRRTVSNLSSAARIIADSESTRKDLIGKLGIPSERITVVYLGVDRVFRPLNSEEERAGYRRRLGLPDGKIILNFGNNLAYKNVEGVLRAFRLILERDNSVFLVRVDPLSVDQRKLAESLGITDHYLEVRKETDDDLLGLYNCADVFLFPSFKEGFGLPVLEALACGLPVVVSKGTSLKEVAGEVGIYVDPEKADEIARRVGDVLRSGPISDSERALLVRRASPFTWESTARKTLAVYNTVLEDLNSTGLGSTSGKV